MIAFLKEVIDVFTSGRNGHRLKAAFIAGGLRMMFQGAGGALMMAMILAALAYKRGASFQDMTQLPVQLALLRTQTSALAKDVELQNRLIAREIEITAAHRADESRHLSRADLERLALLPEIRDELRIIRGLQINESWQKRHE